MLSTQLSWLLLPNTTLAIPTDSTSLKPHTEKSLGSEEKGLWVAPVTRTQLQARSDLLLSEISYLYNSQHIPISRVPEEALGLFVEQSHFSPPFLQAGRRHPDPHAIS